MGPMGPMILIWFYHDLSWKKTLEIYGNQQSEWMISHYLDEPVPSSSIIVILKKRGLTFYLAPKKLPFFWCIVVLVQDLTRKLLANALLMLHLLTGWRFWGSKMTQYGTTDEWKNHKKSTNHRGNVHKLPGNWPTTWWFINFITR